jgi:MerR family transcriptional regulator/heat shock protein HspR
MFTIGFAAKKIGVSPETLRLYEREGLVLTYKTETGRRLYSQRDLEWIFCIRRQINENRLNIGAIKRLLALVPCWDIRQCSDEDRKACPAYLSSDKVCWEMENKPTVCDQEECRRCEVYLNAGQLNHLKKSFKLTLRGSRA